jgi:methylmalonyl-CoA epimerase
MKSAPQGKVDIIDAWHITIATDEIDSKVKHFWNDLGIGPWQFLTIKSPENLVKLNGKPVALEVEAAAANVGFLMIGYDKPRTKPSPFDDMISKRGSGGHHLAFMVDDFETSHQHMLKSGYHDILYADGIGLDGDGIGTYYDTIEDMGTIIEFSKMPKGGMPVVEKVYPENGAEKRTSNINILSTVHVAIAVRDVEKAVRCYEKALGIGPWQFVTLTGPAKYKGKTIEYSVRAAMIKTGSYVLALEQPLSETGPLQDFLAANGQGLHHICLEVDNVEEAAREMRRMGYDEMFAVRGFGPNRDGDASYFDTEKTLGIIIELAKAPTGDLFA